MWATSLALLMLGPALAPGYVLSYDMVWVPDLALRPDFLGLGSALPRAVPSDAVVAVVDEVVPGMLLQKAVLLGALVAAGLGAARLVGGPLAARLVACSIAVWNPFVVERLVIGHWPVLLGYAVLPWLFVVARTVRREGRVPAVLPALVLLGSLSAAAGVATATVVLLTGLRRRAARTNAVLVATLVAANAPWVLAGILHASSATSDPEGARVFAAADEGLLPGPLAAISLGGIWNSEVVPGSRTGVLGVVFLVLVLGLAASGVQRARARTDARERTALVAAWVLGVGLAVVSWAAPGVLGVLAEALPGGGLLRDGSRLLGLAVPLTAVLVGHGAAELHDRVPDQVSRVVLAAVLAVLPVTLMPDAAFGVTGALRAVTFPGEYEDARRAVNRAPGGDVVVLPFSSYRAPEWNGGRPVLDPLPRVVDRDAVFDDVLTVSGRPIAGEDARAAQVRRVLARPTAEERTAGLLGLGVSVAVAGNVPGQAVPQLIGETVLDRTEVSVVVLDGDVVRRARPASWVVVMAAGWGAWLLVPVGVVTSGLIRRARVRRDSTKRTVA